MYLSKITLRRGIDINVLSRIVQGDNYTAHQNIWSLFKGRPDDKRDFIFRRDDEGAWPRFYIVSSVEPVDSSGSWGIDSKLYAPKLYAGQRLSFTLRANPVRKRKAENGKGKRHDVVMEVKTELGKSGKPRKEWPAVANIAQDKGIEWLNARAGKHGFSINDNEVRVDGYRQHSSFKGKGKSAIRFSTLDFTGLLEVTDQGKFLKSLFEGIGPAKGFGCGMMMVRKI